MVTAVLDTVVVQGADAAAESAAQAEFSATYARHSAEAANSAAASAKASALAAGKSKEEADTAASQAWSITGNLRNQEIESQGKAAEEQRRQQNQAAKKKPCIPYPSRDNLPLCMLDTGSGGDHYFQPLDIDPTMTAIFWQVTGLNDVKDCIKDPTLGKCSMAAMMVLPIGRLKAAGEIAEGVQALANGTRAFRAVNGGFKVGVTADEIVAINRKVGGTGIILRNHPEQILASASYYNSFYDKLGAVIYGLVKGHTFDDGVKRTTIEVAELLVQRNNVSSVVPPGMLSDIVFQVGEGKLADATAIGRAISGR